MNLPKSEAAFLRRFDEHYAALFRFAWPLTGSVADAEDIVQESFLGLLRPACALTFVGVVRNQSLKRRNQTGPSGDERSHVQTPETELLRAELKDVVAQAVMQLPDTQREVLLLVHHEQMALAEIAQIMELELGAVKSHLQRARASLKETLAARAPARSGKAE